MEAASLLISLASKVRVRVQPKLQTFQTLFSIDEPESKYINLIKTGLRGTTVALLPAPLYPKIASR